QGALRPEQGFRVVTYAVLAIAVVLAAYLLLSYQVYRRAFVPARAAWLDDFSFTPFEFQADYEEVELVTADGINFGAWHFRQPGSPQTVIISGGHKGQRQGALGIAVALWRKGFNVVLYSYRGMPGSDRAPVTFGIKEVLELQAAIAFARKRIPNARIGLLGYSMGAVVSMLGAAGEPGVQALVLDSPFSDLRRLLVESVRNASKLPGTPFVWMAGVMLWLRTRCRLSMCRPIDVMSTLEPRPLFFIHGGADEITNVNHSRRLYDAYRGPREIWIIQGAPHTGAYFADRPLYVERVAGFFARHLGLDVSSHLRLVEEEEVS
ncbi:MAG TPA: alpha/beta fold hydrolase, partial [Candidatus Acidoferrales bacterium]|nr:alpha/beta fold hydrolase [Candidatus Acidoferrales bacterium]